MSGASGPRKLLHTRRGMFRKRIFSSLVWVLFCALVIFRFPSWAFRLVVTAIVGLGLFEFYSLGEQKGYRVGKFFSTAMGMLVPLLAHHPAPGPQVIALHTFLVVLFFLGLFGYQFAKRENPGSLAGLSLAIAGIVYVAVLFSFSIPLHNGSPGAVAFLVLVVKGGDIGAYIVGSTVGKHPLIPRISPSKTVEGTVGGLGVSVAVAFAAMPLLALYPRGTASFLPALLLGLLLGGVGLFGDLAESLIKRDCNVKDSRKFIPGMGGVLDVIDSLLFAAPLFYAWWIMVTRSMVS